MRRRARASCRPFHTWFAEKSPWSGPNSLGPVPGLLVGGPNSAIGDAGAPAWLSPPANQPPSKAFKDWSTAWNPARQANENSWAFTEPAIYYQARYVLLLSQFVAREKSANIEVIKPAHRPRGIGQHQSPDCRFVQPGFVAEAGGNLRHGGRRADEMRTVGRTGGKVFADFHRLRTQAYSGPVPARQPKFRR